VRELARLLVPRGPTPSTPTASARSSSGPTRSSRAAGRAATV